MWLIKIARLHILLFLTAITYVSSQNVTISGVQPRAVTLAKVVKGSISISKNVTDAIILEGVERVEGNIECVDGQMPAISSDTLTSIGGSLRFHGLATLSGVSLPKLLSLDTLDLEDVPKLSQLELNRGFNNVSEIRITNSGLKTFKAHPPRPGSVIEMFNNSALTEITFPFAPQEVGRPWVRIVNPGDNAKVDLGDVIHARFLILKGFLGSIHGLDNLQIVDRDFVIENKLVFDCSQFSELRYGGFSCTAKNSTATSVLTSEGLATLRGSSTGALNSGETNKPKSETSAASSTRISTGAKAAVAILAVGLAAALALLAFFILRYRKVKATDLDQKPDLGPQELSIGSPRKKTELPNDELHDTTDIPPEENRSEILSPACPINAHELPTSGSPQQLAEVGASPIPRRRSPSTAV